MFQVNIVRNVPTAEHLDSTICLAPLASLPEDIQHEKETPDVQTSEFEIATDSVQDHTLLDDSEVLMSPRSPPAKECFTSSSPFQFNSTVSNETTPRQSCDRYLNFRNGVFLPPESYDETALRSRSGIET
ncbi:hypothetical protein Bca4012_057374 [Brassica carinata]|uniref:Uncharacterized protein n=1 Tax=Brassica carinata TaxID=52824 RepID=A0A8X8B4W0_BRACI|nr:hypothetical protein Bca52824_015888 [Brassica carinata]